MNLTVEDLKNIKAQMGDKCARCAKPVEIIYIKKQYPRVVNGFYRCLNHKTVPYDNADKTCYYKLTDKEMFTYKIL